MDGVYDVMFGGEPVGKMFVDRQGLYYRFRCRCGLTGEGMYRVRVFCGEEKQDLGILVPMEGDFGLQKRLPAKLFPEGMPRFLAVPRRRQLHGGFQDMSPKEPFSYIRELKAEFLRRRTSHL